MIESRLPVVPRSLAAATGACTGVAAGFLIGDGDFTILVAAVLFTVGALAVSAMVVPRSAWRDVLPLVAFATVLRAAVAVVLYDGLLAAGRGGFITGDDAEYADISSRLARILRGEAAPFNYGAESYLLGTFVYIETAIFYLFGPKVLIVELLNAALGGMLVAFVFDIARRLFADKRAGVVAAAVVSVYPSLVLWSALNLKDSLVLLLIALVLWLLVLFQSRQARWLIPMMFAPLLLMESLRLYIFVGLALVIPAGVAVAPARLRDRIFSTAPAIGLAGVLMMAHFAGVSSPLTSGLAGLEKQRFAMGIGAKTSFVDVATVEVDSTTTYVIPAARAPASAHAVQSASPTSTPRVVVVAPGTRLAVSSSDASQASPTPSTSNPAVAPPPDVVLVRPGDIVVVGPPDATPAPVEQRKTLEVPTSATAVQLATTAEGDRLVRTLRYLPTGFAFVLLAPFPWAVSRPLDLLPVPEMLLWYLALAGALVSTVRFRRSWWRLLPAVLFVIGTALVLVLAEGNVGTLYRHRAMLIPFVLILASPVFARALPHLGPQRT